MSSVLSANPNSMQSPLLPSLVSRFFFIVCARSFKSYVPYFGQMVNRGQKSAHSDHAQIAGEISSAQKHAASEPPSPILMPNSRFTTVGQVAVPPASVSKRPPATEGLETTSAAERGAGEKTSAGNTERARNQKTFVPRKSDIGLSAAD